MRKILNGNYKFIRDDKGSTLITVIVAISFVTILTAIILGTTTINMRMKGIDKHAKDDFYYAEKAINDIYAGLGMELAEMAGEEYEAAFEKVGETMDIPDPSNPGSYITKDFGLSEKAEKEFKKNFLEKAHDDILNPLSFASLEEKLQDYVTDKGTVKLLGSVEYRKKDGSTTSSSDDADMIVIDNVQVTVKDITEVQSVISTDIVIKVPTMDFLGANADVSDYGIIANQGLYIYGNSETVINGNVYAGVHKTATAYDDDFVESNDVEARGSVYGGINIYDSKSTFKGNYIVSKGDINIAGTNPRLRIYNTNASGDANLPNVWFTSLRTLSTASLPTTASTEDDITSTSNTRTIDIDANIYALNDLKLNSKYSDVRIKGNYYGYNDKTLASPINPLDIPTGRDDTASSAIIVNGSDATLDMRDINNLVLMGKAYVDFTSTGETISNPNKQVVATAEGVALKTNQQLYLVPTDFLDTPNPVLDSGYNASTGFVISKDDTYFNSSGTYKGWFGLKYVTHSSTSTDYNDMFDEYTVGSGTDAIHYAYLKFNEDTWDPIVSGGTITGYSDTPNASTVTLGTGGCISSKAHFFYDIMTAEQKYKDAFNGLNPADKALYSNDLDEYIEKQEQNEAQPSAYRLYERIYKSMGYEFFNLQNCVVGDNSVGATGGHYYAKNAVVNYRRDASNVLQTNVLENTDGMYRYLNYPSNLYIRYKYLCTELKGLEDYTMDADLTTTPGDVSAADWQVEYTDASGVITDAPPISYFASIKDIPASWDIDNKLNDANNAGLKTAAYGAFVVRKGDLVIGSGTAPDGTALSSDVPAANGLVAGRFKGVAIVDGDIILAPGQKVDGLLMATGKVILCGNNEVNYDKGIIQARIEKEMSLVKGDSSATGLSAYKDYYLIRYLTEGRSSGDSITSDSDLDKLLYNVTAGTKVKQDRIEADYNEFMYYANWQKGER